MGEMVLPGNNRVKPCLSFLDLDKPIFAAVGFFKARKDRHFVGGEVGGLWGSLPPHTQLPPFISVVCA